MLGRAVLVLLVLALAMMCCAWGGNINSLDACYASAYISKHTCDLRVESIPFHELLHDMGYGDRSLSISKK